MLQTVRCIEQRWLTVVLSLLCAVLAGRALGAQTIGGTVSGVITDPSGSAIPLAALVFRSISMQTVRAIRANESGFYSVPNLTPGEYQVRASAPGFELQIVYITLTVGAEQELNFNLRVGLLDQSVEVQAPPAGLEFASSAIGGVVNENTLQEVPLNGRGWTDLAALDPGVAPIEAQVSYTAGVGRGNRGFGAQLAISGARPQQNNYLLDGISINDYSNGGPGSVLGGNLGVDAIQEFSIFTANYPAAYGRASGGVISAATRSGSNQFHGSVYEFLRNSALDARNFFDKASPPPFRRNQYGVSVGGPVIKNQTFLFGDYEAIRQSLGVTNVVTVPSPAARNGTLSTGGVTVDRAVQQYLGFYSMPNGGLLGKGDTGIFTFAGQQVTNEDFFTTRVDHRFSGSDSLFGAYHFDNARFTSPDNLDTEFIGSATRNQTAVVELNHIFSTTMLNTLRFGVNRSAARNNESVSALIPQASDLSLGATPNRTAASLTVPGLSPFNGGLGGAGTYLFHYTSLQVYDDLYSTRGLHSLKFGFAIERMRNNILALSNPNGQFTFNSLADFLTNRPASFNMGLAQTLSPRGLRQTVAGVYVQDDWRAHANLTINLGLRYEMATVPTEVQGKLSALRNVTDAQPHLGDPLFANPTLRNLEPRVGFSWDPFGDGKTAVRSGFGIYDVLPLTYQFELLSSLVAPFFVNSTVTNPPPGSFPAAATSLLNATSLARAYIEPEPHRNYAMQWNVNIQRTLARDLSGMIAYVGSHGVHDPFRTDDINMVLPAPTAAGYLWPSPAGSGPVVNPDAGQIRALFWEGSSSYNALQLQIRRNMHHGFQIQGAFTWSKSIDDGSSILVGNAFSNSFNGPHFYDLRRNRGVSDFNIPRVAVINGVWEVPSTPASSSGIRFLRNGWQLSSIFKVSDGIPFTALIAGDPLGQKSAAPADFPDRLTSPECKSLVNSGSPVHYIKTQCFTFPLTGTLLGDAGRNILTGPGQTNLDFAVVKNMRVHKISDTSRAQFRAELFNALNHANFMPPLDNLKLFDAKGQPIASAGLLTATATTARQIQFALKLIW